MELRPFFSFYGGKWRDARRYPAPLHDMIIEPFAGSAGYSMRYASRRVVLCDSDEHIAGVWAFLIRATREEVLSIPDLGPDETIEDLHICQEARWLVGFWLNRAPEQPRPRPSSWMRSGIRPGSFWGARVRETIARQLDAIRHWQIRHASYESLPIERATWFVDSPYQGAGRHYRHGADAIDFAELGAWCARLPGQVIVCENAGATWLPFVPLASTKTTRRGKRSHEACWVGGMA